MMEFQPLWSIPEWGALSVQKPPISAAVVDSRVGGGVTCVARYICLFSANWKQFVKNPVGPVVNF